jgi:hypothetical protein
LNAFTTHAFTEQQISMTAVTRRTTSMKAAIMMRKDE